MSNIDHESLDRALGLLGDLMRVRHHPPIHLVVYGGSALIALRLVTRTTQDVDVLATLEDGQLHCARPLPEWLLAAARWTFTQDVSDAFRQIVVEVLQALGHGDLHERL